MWYLIYDIHDTMVFHLGMRLHAVLVVSSFSRTVVLASTLMKTSREEDGGELEVWPALLQLFSLRRAAKIFLHSVQW